MYVQRPSHSNRNLSQRACSSSLKLFNPPYVPTPPEEMHTCGLAASWAGGEKGRQIIDEFLPSVPGFLSERGAFYLVTISQNDPQAVLEQMTSLGLVADVALVRDADEEKLTILRARRNMRT